MVSIIVTTYNYAHFLDETLTSVREQTYNDWECIVVDGGSTDNTSDVVNKFVNADKRFKYHKKDYAGVSAARNAGIKISKGEYLQFLDGDDLLQADKIRSQLLAFEQNQSADIVYCSVLFFDDGKLGQLRSSLLGNKPDDWLPHLSCTGKDALKYLRSMNFLVTHSPLLKRHVAESNNGFDEKMAAHEDWDFWLRAAINGNYFHFHSAENDIVLVRVHSNSLSKRKDLMLEGKFILYSKVIFNPKIGFADLIFFIVKNVELFWDTIFSSMKLPKINFLLFVVSLLMFPVWIVIKCLRLIKIL